MTNVAVVQILQALAVIFWLVMAVVVVVARRHLPRTKVEPLLDVVLVVVLVVYAIVMKIYFST